MPYMVTTHFMDGNHTTYSEIEFIIGFTVLPTFLGYQSGYLGPICFTHVI